MNPQLTLKFKGWDETTRGLELEMWIDVNNTEHRTKQVLRPNATDDEKLYAFKHMRDELLNHFMNNLLTIHLEDTDANTGRNTGTAIHSVFSGTV
jgi:hypothetical protein